jgi:nucleotide-binding universal stress UspA family protein
MYDRILLPVAGDEAEGAVPVERAADLASPYGAAVIVLSVADTAVFDPLGSRGTEASAAREREAERTAEEVADEMNRLLQGSDARARSMVGHGSAHRAILEAADSNDCDLVVMATHGRTGVRHGLLGSVTERVLRLSDVPVLAVPRGES